MSRQKSETEVEKDHSDRARAAGWFVEKIMKCGRNGFPDRFYARGSRIILMEWKRPNGDGVVSPIQKARHKELRAAGVEIHVVYSIEEADEILGIV